MEWSAWALHGLPCSILRLDRHDAHDFIKKPRRQVRNFLEQLHTSDRKALQVKHISPCVSVKEELGVPDGMPIQVGLYIIEVPQTRSLVGSTLWHSASTISGSASSSVVINLLIHGFLCSRATKCIANEVRRESVRNKVVVLLFCQKGFSYALATHFSV